MKQVIALGGNALGNNIDEQKINIDMALRKLLPLLVENSVVITHGNGPQVGMINKVFEKSNIKMPLPESTAMSEGYIGYHIVSTLKKIFKEHKVDKNVAAIITEVGVSSFDEAFSLPTKPIGNFYTKEEAIELAKKENAIYKEDSGRGYRKYVASPEPLEIKDKELIELLLSKNYVVVAIGGGGIPYLIESGNPCDAVIDKDKASAKLGELISADELLIVTSVDNVQINFGKETAKKLFKTSVEEIDVYLKNGEFKEGSMKPKIEAALQFLKNTETKQAVITSLENIDDIDKATIIKR